VNLPAWLKPVQGPYGFCEWGQAEDGSIWNGREGSIIWQEYQPRTSGKKTWHEPTSLRCQCGNRAFTLTCGEYSMTGTCTQCGASEVVYEG
jgi:hypothetical protein